MTNALDAAVVSGIPGVQNINQAMGALLATVGSGDMTMQNLADALGTGILSVAKQFGVTMADVGASMATFGDNMIRGKPAATDLRMVIFDLVKQSKAGQKVLGDLGFAAGQLGKDMQTGGLKKAILDLHAHLEAAHITGTKVGTVLADIFTKRSAAPLAILMGELNQFQSKYPELKKGANSFGDAWAHTAALLSTKFKQVKAQVEAMFIGIGHFLAPYASTILGYVTKAFDWMKQGNHMKVFGEWIKTFLIGALVVLGAVLAGMAIEAAPAILLFVGLSLAIGALVKEFMHLYNTNSKVRAFVAEVVKVFKKDAVEAVHWLMRAFAEAKKIVGEVIQAIIGFYEKHRVQINNMVMDVVKVLGDLWSVFKSAFDYVVAIVKTAVKIIMDLWDRFGKHLWDHIVTAWNNIIQVVRGAFNIVKGFFDIITGILTGNWSKFWGGIKDVVSGVWNVISGVVKAGINFISTIIGAGIAAISAVWGLVWHTIENVFSYVWKGIVAGLRWVFHLFTDIPNEIRQKLSGAENWLVTEGWKIIKGLLTGIGHGIVWLWDWAERLPSDLFNKLGQLVSWMETLGRNIITGIWNGIAGAASWLWDKVKGWASGLWHGIKSFFGIGSPSRLMADTVGKHLMTGMAAGILENQHHVYNAMMLVSKKVAGTQINTGAFGWGNGGPGMNGNFNGGHGMVGSGTTVYNITVKGDVIDTQGLFKAVQQATQQHGSRNTTNGLSFRR
jgi:TP901 family phage tail tape measure protein